MLAVAGIAAYVSYWHAYAVVRAHGESGITARLEPATIDGLVYASSMVVLYASRHRLPVPCLARWLPGLGIAATLTANMAQGWSHGPVWGRWPRPGPRSASRAPMSSWSGSSALRTVDWLSAEHLGDGCGLPCRAGSAPDAAVDSEQYSPSEREVPGQASPRIGVAGRPAHPRLAGSVMMR